MAQGGHSRPTHLPGGSRADGTAVCGRIGRVARAAIPHVSWIPPLCPEDRFLQSHVDHPLLSCPDSRRLDTRVSLALPLLSLRFGGRRFGGGNRNGCRLLLVGLREEPLRALPGLGLRWGAGEFTPCLAHDGCGEAGLATVDDCAIAGADECACCVATSALAQGSVKTRNATTDACVGEP